MAEIVRKLEAAQLPDDLRGSSLNETQDRELRLRLTAAPAENMKKRAVVTFESPPGSTFEMVCDEGAQLGGDDEAPPPLSYFAAAVAF